MKGIRRAICALVLLTLGMPLAPAQATVIEDLMKHHPVVALVNGRNTQTQTNMPSTLGMESGTSAVAGTLPDARQPAVSPEDMTVEIVPLRVPELPTQVVFVIYLVGALVFYTLLILIAQPGPPEYS